MYYVIITKIKEKIMNITEESTNDRIKCRHFIVINDDGTAHSLLPKKGDEHPSCPDRVVIERIEAPLADGSGDYEVDVAYGESKDLPSVTNIPPMPKVKDPKPEDKPTIIDDVVGMMINYYADNDTQLTTVQLGRDEWEAVLILANKMASPMIEVEKPTTLCGLRIEMSNKKRYMDVYADEDIESPLPRKEVISIQPGDVVVVSTPEQMTEREHKGLSDILAEIMPKSKSLILSGGMSLEVYREQGKIVDVTGLDGKKTFAKVGEQVKDV